MVREIPQHLRCDVHLKVALRWKLDKKDPRLELIKRAGFDWIQQMENFNLDIDLIRFFYSRFRKDLGTFDLGNEKYMITLEDVLNLTGLTIAGDAIVWKEDKDTNKLCEKYLGKVPKETQKVGGKVKLEWLRDNFQKLKKNASLKDVENSARAYLLHTIGAFIFPDGSGAMVSSIYLTFLDDFDKAKTFSWGSAMLTQLITNLQKDPSKKGNVNLSGNAALLMYWVYERFPDFRPEGVGLVNRVVPLMVGWTRKITNSSLNVYKDCRMDYYEELANEENIRYSSILDVQYPPHLSHLKNQKNLAKVDVPLFHGSTCFIYRPSCCPHQFEDVPSCQSTPPLLSAFKHKQKKSRKGPQGNVDWHVEHEDLLTLWNTQRLETVSGSIDESEEESKYLVEEGLVDERQKIGISKMVGLENSSRTRQVVNSGQDLPMASGPCPGSSAGSERGSVEVTREDVEALLKVEISQDEAVKLQVEYECQKRELTETRRALEKLIIENECKSKECQEAWKSLKDLQNELMCKTMHDGHLRNFSENFTVYENPLWEI